MRPFLIASCFSLAACSHKGPPSQEFADANAKYTQLYGQKLEDAFVDPAMEQVVDLLNQVPSNSVDRPSADELLQRINDGRAAIAARNAAIKADMEKLNAPVPAGAFRADSRDKPTGSEAAPVDAGQDAGQPSEPMVGMSVADMKARWGGCFQSGPSVQLAGAGPRDTYVFSDSFSCSQTLPSFVNRAVIADATRIVALATKSQVMPATPPAPAVAKPQAQANPGYPPAPAEGTSVPPPSEGTTVPPPMEGTTVPPGTPTGHALGYPMGK